MIKQGFLALVVGMGLGVITTWLKLPLPAQVTLLMTVIDQTVNFNLMAIP